MRILSLARDYPKAHSFVSAHEVIHASLNPPDAAETSGAIALPSGRFPIQMILDQLPSGWQPDCIQISSSLGVFSREPAIPTGLDQINCPSAMKLTDSHFRHRPIQSLIEYSQAVGCQYHWTTYDRHHLHFFQKAGLPNAFWMPGAASIHAHQPQVASQKVYDVLFCGANSPGLHPRRAKLLSHLQTAGVNVTITRKPYLETLEAYTAATIVFNCSLNGDLNRRVFETLMAGGFLMTDRLSAESGLSQLFQEGVHLECYGSEQELLEKVQYYLARPGLAAQIARQGHEQFLQHCHPLKLEEQFLGIVVKGDPIPPLLLGQDDDRTLRSRQSDTLLDRIRIYELIHDLHRCNEDLTLLDYLGNHAEILADLRDLSRLRILQEPQLEKAAIALLDCPNSEAELKTALAQLQPHLQSDGLVLILGQAASQFEMSIRSWGWRSLRLKESGEGACLVYQNPAAIAQTTHPRIILPLDQPLSLSDRIVLSAKTTAKKVLASLALPS